MAKQQSGINFEDLFIDSAEMTVDAKNRVGIPEKFMKVLRRLCPDDADKIGVCPTPDSSICLMPRPRFESQLAEWREKMTGGSAEQRRMLTTMTSLSGLFPLDAQNRVKLNPTLMRICSIKRDVIITGNIDYMQIFDLNGFEKSMIDGLQQFDAMMEKSVGRQAPQTQIQYVINPPQAQSGEDPAAT